MPCGVKLLKLLEVGGTVMSSWLLCVVLDKVVQAGPARSLVSVHVSVCIYVSVYTSVSTRQCLHTSVSVYASVFVHVSV
jgi:hypothetical protein